MKEGICDAKLARSTILATRRESASILIDPITEDILASNPSICLVRRSVIGAFPMLWSTEDPQDFLSLFLINFYADSTAFYDR